MKNYFEEPVLVIKSISDNVLLGSVVEVEDTWKDWESSELIGEK